MIIKFRDHEDAPDDEGDEHHTNMILLVSNDDVSEKLSERENFHRASQQG